MAWNFENLNGKLKATHTKEVITEYQFTIYEIEQEIIKVQAELDKWNFAKTKALELGITQ